MKQIFIFRYVLSGMILPAAIRFSLGLPFAKSVALSIAIIIVIDLWTMKSPENTEGMKTL